MTLLAPACPVLNDLLDGFFRGVATLAGGDAGAMDRLCARIGIPRDPAQWRSTLNNDGSPVQVCIGLRAGGAPSVRVIADPHIGAKDPASRSAQSRRALLRLAGWHAPDMAGLCSSVLARVAPSGCAIPYLRDGGDVWFAAGIGGCGTAIYATTRWGDPAARWTRAIAWLRDVSPTAARSTAMLAELAAHTTLISVGVEGSAAGNARAKFYWRPNGSAPLAGLGIPLLTHEALPAFLADATEGMAVPASAIVGSVGVHLASGSIADVKLDLCGHCVSRSRIDWADRIDRYAQRHRLTGLPLAALDPEAPVEIAFVGLGVDDDHRPRLNVYLKPILSGSGARP